jgi:hypothetical protein
LAPDLAFRLLFRPDKFDAFFGRLIDERNDPDAEGAGAQGHVVVRHLPKRRGRCCCSWFVPALPTTSMAVGKKTSHKACEKSDWPVALADVFRF